MSIPRCRNLFLLKNSLVSSSPSSSAAAHLATFHSTAASFQKWKNKWNFDDVKGAQQPTKNYVRYATRQKRADTKKALKDILYKCGATKISLEDADSRWKLGKKEDKSDNSNKKHKSKYWARHADKSHQKKTKRKFKSDFEEDFNVHPETIFQAAFGKRCYTWSFNSRHDSSFKDSSSGFEWRENPSWKHRSKSWGSSSESESDDVSYTIGSCSDRTILGLPPAGPLKIEDVKKAFRLSALKWHPDKHQGSSQAMAEEKFKHCVDAYKSLCKVLSPA